MIGAFAPSVLSLYDVGLACHLWCRNTAARLIRILMKLQYGQLQYPNALNCREIPFLTVNDSCRNCNTCRDNRNTVQKPLCLVSFQYPPLFMCVPLKRMTIVLCVTTAVMTLHSGPVEKEAAGRVELRCFIVMEKHLEKLSCRCASEVQDVNLTLNMVSVDEPVERSGLFPTIRAPAKRYTNLSWKITI